MSKAPAPLVDANIDVSDYPWMGIDIRRLFDSEIHAISNDAEWRAGLTLWLKSFQMVPGGSISGNDKVLARTVEFDEAKWKKVKKVALHNWVKCSDGRWYHPVVCEKVWEAWLSKLHNGKSSAAGNAKRYGGTFDPEPWDAKIAHAMDRIGELNPRSRVLAKKQSRIAATEKKQPLSGPQAGEIKPDNSGLDAGPVEPASGRSPGGSPGGSPPASRRDRNKQEQEQIQEQNISLSEKTAPHAKDERERFFTRFAGAYPPAGLKLPDDARRALDMRLDEGVPIDDIVAGAEAYDELCRKEGRTGRFVKAAHSWLAGGGWKDVKPPDKASDIASDRTFVTRDDPRWPSLVAQYRAGNRTKTGPPGEKGWYFSNTWIEKLRESVEA